MFLCPLLPVEPSKALRPHPTKTFVCFRTFFVYCCLRTLCTRVYNAYVPCRINNTQQYSTILNNTQQYQLENLLLGQTELVAHVQFNQGKAQLGMIGPTFFATASH